MEDNMKNYTIGSKGEKETWPFLNDNGFVRPTITQRKEIVEYYLSKNKKIEKRGFDVIKLSDLKNIGKKDITLYEVKTTGKSRGQNVNEHFNGLGFTLSGKEKNNAEELENNFRFIFVNLSKRILKICKLSDFFNKEIANLYQTWSVFIIKDLK
jgi:hypothetical protein